MCGFYAWTNVLAAMDEVVRRGHVGPLVMLKIAGSGKVIEHEYGWRSEEATPLAVLWAAGYSVNNAATVATAGLLEVPLEHVDVEYELDTVEEEESFIETTQGTFVDMSRSINSVAIEAAISIDTKAVECVTKAAANRLYRELYGEP